MCLYFDTTDGYLRFISTIGQTTFPVFVGRRGTNWAQSPPDLELYLDVLVKHTTEIPPSTALVEGTAPSALVEDVSLRWFILSCEYLISLNQIHGHTCYQSHRENGSQNLQQLSDFPKRLSNFPKRLSDFPQQLSDFPKRLSNFLNGFPISSTAFVTSTISQDIQMMIMLTHTWFSHSLPELRDYPTHSCGAPVFPTVRHI